MRRFAIRSASLLIPLFSILVYFEFKLGQIPNSYNFKRRCLENQLGEIQVLILGSSQALFDINPDYFSRRGFNLGNTSQSLFYDSRLTMKYLDKMPKLSFVIINISSFSFGLQVIDGPESWRDFYYSQFWGINFPELPNFDSRRYSKLFLYTPKTSFGFFLKRFHVDLAGGFQQNGYLKIDTVRNWQNISDSSGYNRVRFHEAIWNEKRVPENLKELGYLIKELERRNIQPILVSPPVYSTYSRHMNPERNRKNQQRIDSICEKFHCNYYNYLSDSRFVERDFYDNDHMNFIGAEKFSRIINSEILGCN